MTERTERMFWMMVVTVVILAGMGWGRNRELRMKHWQDEYYTTQRAACQKTIDRLADSQARLELSQQALDAKVREAFALFDAPPPKPKKESKPRLKNEGVKLQPIPEKEPAPFIACNGACDDKMRAMQTCWPDESGQIACKPFAQSLPEKEPRIQFHPMWEQAPAKLYTICWGDILVKDGENYDICVPPLYRKDYLEQLLKDEEHLYKEGWYQPAIMGAGMPAEPKP